ncbi:LTA synthase family protein [Pseudalkalibacillus decolorationis]|uniref:LTA synthase family protein n=1 Tax=Pseudalkalibacillus decolorationis TaxID=163879 RepID=UPI002147BE4E|nr:LTA synthase family protein [Pseudalkalibacillus decolorationis]
MISSIRSTQSLFWTAVVLLWIKTYIIYKFYLHLSGVTLLEEVMMFVNPLASVILLLGWAFFFTNKMRSGYIIALSVLATGILYADLLYYRFYIDFVTIPVLLQLDNVGGLGPSTVELMSPADALLFIDLIALFWIAKGNRLKPTVFSIKKKLSIVAVALLLLVATIGTAKVVQPHLMAGLYNREKLVSFIGTFNYHLYDLFEQVKSTTKNAFADGDQVDEIRKYVDEQSVEPDPELFGAAKGKNLIVVMLESTQNFVINREINGEEVTPFLNSLIDNSYYFNEFYHQTAQGKTSDAEFMIDNSLYPLASGSVFVRKPENEYTALPEILGEHGYKSYVFHGNDKTFWNRNIMYDSLGYDKFFSKEFYNVTQENSVNYGIKDIPFFNQSAAKFEQLDQPFYAKFITLTNHFPFLLNEDVMISPPNTDEDVVNGYFKTVRYLDESVKRLFQLLKDKGLYEDSVIVLMGDHYGISQNYYDDGLSQVLGHPITPPEHIKLQRVPLFIHVPGEQGKTVETVSGQVDLRPTLLHLLGIKTDDYIHLGQDMLAKKENFTVLRHGSFITENYIYTDDRCFDKESGELVSRGNCNEYFGKRNQELHYSDMVIYEDLLRFYEKDASGKQ